MQLVFQVLGVTDIDEVYNFADEALKARVSDETERMFQSWSVKWRREALEHYLKLGWSFIVRTEKGETLGFFLAQPFLFFRGQTQTVWVEHVEAQNQDVAEALVEVAVKVAREKHMQRVLFADANTDLMKKALVKWNSQPLSEEIAEIRTTKG